MSDTKLSLETPATTLSPADLVRISQFISGAWESRQATLAQLVSLVGGGGGSGDGSLSAPALPMPQGAGRDGSNSVFGLGSSGQFDNGSVRDNDLFFARGKLWLLYTGASTSSSPFNPTLGLASSTDAGHTWTRLGQIVPKNPTSGQWNSGGVFSPCAYYDEDTDELYLYVSGIQTGSDWYSGPIVIGVLKAAAGADWSDPASFSYLNGGSPIITVTQSAWEGSQGVYAPSVKKLNGKIVMLYSSSNGSSWKIGRATASTPAGPFTKDTANPVMTGAEEPSMLQLAGGTLIALCDNLNVAYGIAVWACSTPDGMGTWTKQGLILTTGAQTFDGALIGSSSAVLMYDGSIVIMYNGKSSSAPDDRRTIGRATARMQLNVAPDVAAINQLISDAASAGGGGSSPYTQVHIEPIPGARIFDLSKHGRPLTFHGSISNNTANPLFGSVAIHSTAGNGYITSPASTDFNIASGEDYTFEGWFCFQNAAGSLEMLLEFNGGFAIYRGTDGKIEVAHSGVAAIHKDSTYVTPSGTYVFLVCQRTNGTMAFFHAVEGDTYMTAGSSYTGETTAFSSTDQMCIMAGNNGGGSFVYGDMGSFRFTPGQSLGYSSSTPVPTAALPQ